MNERPPDRDASSPPLPMAHVPKTPLPIVRELFGLQAVRMWLGAGGQVDQHGRISS